MFDPKVFLAALLVAVVMPAVLRADAKYYR